jgi:hypothetical protein
MASGPNWWRRGERKRKKMMNTFQKEIDENICDMVIASCKRVIKKDLKTNERCEALHFSYICTANEGCSAKRT